MDVERLSSMISSLSDIHARLERLKNVPPSLLRPPVRFSSSSIRGDFEQLKELADTIRSDSVQEALRTANTSEKADRSDLNTNGRRESRKRRHALPHTRCRSPSYHFIGRRPPSPESPQPYVPQDKRSASLFPMPTGDPLRVGELPAYIREFNQSHSAKLHIWTRTRGSTQLSNPAVVRFTIRDVVVCYIRSTYSAEDPVLITESVTAFGPRETKSPHSQSDFLVYQCLSQQIAKMLQCHPRISLQSLTNLMCAYEGMFIDRCTSCERVLSAEGHVPPVVRIWIEAGKETEKGHWEPRHASCPQT
ncbi:hypothetical protein C8J57DRAFT_1049273 [Mycena rebaudengoi]|nr:hypothetical protein C8J57DRAFT_1049273 [Mycena rebaudengoi]